MSSCQSPSKIQRELADKITSHAPLTEIRVLLTNGAHPSGSVVQGLRPLHYAVYSNYTACVRMLIARGANVNALDDVGYAALHLSAESGNLDLIKYLIEQNATVSWSKVPEVDFPQGYRSDEPLRLAIRNGHLECAEYLLQQGADPNASYFLGPELSLISPSNSTFFRLLLNYGADANVYDKEGLTPLMRACRHRDGAETALMLVEAGACVNAWALGRQDCRTPLHYAILSANPKLIDFLLAHEAAVNMVDGYCRPSPLDVAVLRDNLVVLDKLLEAGADPNAAYTHIGSPLHLACCSSELKNQQEIIQRLLQAGADPNLCPIMIDDGVELKSPFLEYFRAQTNAEPPRPIDSSLVKLMLAHGARVVMQSPLDDPRGLLRALTRLKETTDDRKLWQLLLEASERYCLPTIERLGFPIRRRVQLQQRGSNPPSLTHAVRLSIRKIMIPFTPEKVRKLDITECMKDYLLFEDRFW